MFYHVLRCCKHIQWLEEIKCFKIKDAFLLHLSTSATDKKMYNVLNGTLFAKSTSRAIFKNYGEETSMSLFTNIFISREIG